MVFGLVRLQTLHFPGEAMLGKARKGIVRSVKVFSTDGLRHGSTPCSAFSRQGMVRLG